MERELWGKQLELSRGRSSNNSISSKSADSTLVSVSSSTAAVALSASSSAPNSLYSAFSSAHASSVIPTSSVGQTESGELEM